MRGIKRPYVTGAITFETVGRLYRAVNEQGGEVTTLTEDRFIVKWQDGVKAYAVEHFDDRIEIAEQLAADLRAPGT